MIYFHVVKKQFSCVARIGNSVNFFGIFIYAFKKIKEEIKRRSEASEYLLIKILKRRHGWFIFFEVALDFHPLLYVKLSKIFQFPWLIEFLLEKYSDLFNTINYTLMQLH